jgi:uncharacterized protein (UPF0212 family)
MIIIGQNYSVSTSDPAPSDMQVTSVPKTAKIALEFNRIPANITAPALNGSMWIPARALSAQFQSEMVDVSQYRTLSVLVAPWTARQVNSNDTATIFASDTVKALAGLQTFVTFVDPDTGASTTIQINKDTYSVPVAGPIAFVSIGFSVFHVSESPEFNPADLTAVMYLSS